MGRCLIAATSPQRQQRLVCEIQFPGSGFPQAVSSPAGVGGRVERVGSATASFLHLGRRPAKNAAQHFTKSFCSVAPSVFGSAHVQQHEGTNARKAVNYCQGFGNVCRA